MYFIFWTRSRGGGPNFHFREKEKGEAKAKKRAEEKKGEWIGAEFDGRRFGGRGPSHTTIVYGGIGYFKDAHEIQHEFTLKICVKSNVSFPDDFMYAILTTSFCVICCRKDYW